MIALALGLSLLPSSAMFIYIVPHLTQVGISREISGGVVTLMTAITIAGRLGFGWLGDLFDRRRVLGVAFGLQFFGVLIFAFATEMWHLIPFLLLFSPGFGGAIPVVPALQVDYLGRKNFGTIRGLMFAVTTVGAFASPVLAGWLRDLTGSFRWPFLLLAGAPLFSILVILAARRPGGAMVAS